MYTFSSSAQKPATVCMLHTLGLHLRQQFIKQSNITTDHLNININTAKCTYLWHCFENAVHNECHFKRGRHSTIFSFNSYTKLMYHRYQCQLPYLLNSNVCSLLCLLHHIVISDDLNQGLHVKHHLNTMSVLRSEFCFMAFSHIHQHRLKHNQKADLQLAPLL